MTAVEHLAASVGVVSACLAMLIPRSSFYRHRSPRYGPLRARPTPRRALSPESRQEVLDVLHSDEFIDASPVAAWATLLDRGIHLCSVRTMYRVLAAEGESRERRAQRTHPEYHKPELLALGPNEVWSWDITKLRGPSKWTYFYLSVVIDIYSRYVVGWMVADRENGGLAKRLLEETCDKQGIQPGQLTIHQDRGTPMTSKTVGQMYADLSVEPSYSRPHVSDDNPYSESHFKTLKYRPGFPDRFGSADDVTAHCRNFFPWYNTEHKHSGIGYLTPETVHFGNAGRALRERQIALDIAYAAHPERFVHGPPRVASLPAAAWINPPAQSPALFLSQPPPAGPTNAIVNKDEVSMPSEVQDTSRLDAGRPERQAPSQPARPPTHADSRPQQRHRDEPGPTKQPDTLTVAH
jgi:putative transposase